MRGIKGEVSPEIGRRQCFSIAVKYGLTPEDLSDVAGQVGEMGKLVDKWHAEEGRRLMEILGRRAGRALTELAEEASADAWAIVSGEFETQFPGYVATLVKGRVLVQEE